MKRSLRTIPLALLVATLAPRASTATNYYNITTFGAQNFLPTADINDAGVIAGSTYSNTYQASTAALWNGTLDDLGAFDGFHSSTASAINSSNVVVGWSLVNGPPYGEGSPFHAFSYDGSLHDLGTLGGAISTAYAVNDSGQIAGAANTSAGYSHAFLYDGTMHDLGTLGGNRSFAYGINNNGLVVGAADITGNQRQHAFYYDGTIHDLAAMLNISGDSKAVAVNSAGTVVGTAGQTAFVYDGTLHNLGAFGGTNSEALAINDSGQVVGDADTPFSGSHAFLYDAAHGMVDLNSLLKPGEDWVLSRAVAINNLGQILALGSHGYCLLTPAIPGDVNSDNIVNGQDIALVASNWLETPNMHHDPLAGDANFDDIVNGQDIALIASNWLQAFGNQGTSQAVPEPASLVLGVVGLALASIGGRRCNVGV